TWNVWHIASLWVGMSVCIPTYMLAASMIDAGMTWWQSLVAIVLGNAIVFVPLVINAHAGTRYGIPFPVYARAAFGPRGAHVPSLLRALVACGWFGIQTWIGGLAINALLGILWPGWQRLGDGWRFMGYGEGGVLRDPVDQHRRLHALRAEPARPGPGSGAGAAHHHAAVRLHRRGRHERHAHPLRPGDLEPRGPARAAHRRIPEPTARA